MQLIFFLICSCVSLSGWYDVTDYGAEGDGYTDDYEAVQDAADAAGNGTLYFPTGVYVLDGSVLIKSGTRVLCAGPGTALRTPSGSEAGCALLIDGVSDVFVEGCSFDGLDTNGDQGAIGLGHHGQSTTRIRILNNYFYGWSNGAVNFSDGENEIADITIQNNFFEDIGDNAVEINCEVFHAIHVVGNYFDTISGGAVEVDNGAYDVIIESNHIHDTSEQAIQVEQGSHDSRVVNNWVDTTAFGQDCILVLGDYNPEEVPADSVIVSNNHVENCGGDGIRVQLAHDVIISDNLVYLAASDGIHITESHDVSVSGNKSHSNGDGYGECGIKVVGSMDVSASGNKAHYNYHNGICVQNSQHVLLTANHANNNGWIDQGIGDNVGITLQRSYYCAVTGNSARDTRIGDDRTQDYGMREDWGSDYNTWSANIGRNNKTPTAAYEVYVDGAHSSELGSIEID